VNYPFNETVISVALLVKQLSCPHVNTYCHNFVQFSLSKFHFHGLLVCVSSVSLFLFSHQSLVSMDTISHHSWSLLSSSSLCIKVPHCSLFNARHIVLRAVLFALSF